MKKALAIGVAIVLFLVLVITTILGKGEDVCTPNGNTGGSGVVVNGDFAYPTDKNAIQPSSPFGAREGGDHLGIDLAGPKGTPIYAFADGRVIQAQDSGVQGFGGWVVIEHNIDGEKIQTVYGHMEPGQVHATVGQSVKKGDHIAGIGSAGQSSGPHLHFEVVKGDRAAGGERVDPQPWLDKASEGTPKDDEKDSSGNASKGDKGSGQPVPVEDDGFAGLTGRQLALAKQIVAIGEKLGVDKKGRQIAVATAKHESQLQVYANDGSGWNQSAGASGVGPDELRKSLDYPHDAVGHDHASVGTFQQQVGIWGSVEELMNPAVQAKKFYEALSKIDYASISVGNAASTVQGNATGTGVYNREAEIAAQLVDKFTGAGKELSEEDIEALGDSKIAGNGCTSAGAADSSSGQLPTNFGEAIVEAARSQNGHPYVWGGGDKNGPTGGLDGASEPGYDCSGLVLYAVYVASGGKIELPHNTVAQTQDSHLKPVEWDERQPGDLIFLGDKGSEHHVGIYAGGDKWIEAQTFGVPSGEYDVRTKEPHSVYRVQEG
ncbi:peptidoglycan DD-metalloendopeptidase family protein [Corynebacterium phoceense]|uniref:peptidoglycan DD-metalloendopeptidase family protein n=1 Tax=Corynebacterium phoceense TaxID=1686286 RepID=UPI00211BB62A|nr:peptidoglycan DD-metalloendopeptidase family protein [Corynebacterium phoceense]MCQ9334502.1 peptidoglycan DD-metalloendopeptidase family protein [Corynebacterium phoceense]